MKPVADAYAVMGNPVAHSRSPQIHGLFAQQTGEAVQYTALLVKSGGFAQAVQEFREAGGRGLNVTVPFKQDALDVAESLSPQAQRAGAVNTLVLGASVDGHNTDGIGLLRDLTDNLGQDLEGRRILLLGAGGAVRGVLQPLLAASPAELVIANRTPEKAQELARDFADLGKIRGGGFDALENTPSFDLVINGTAASLSGDVPPIPAGCVQVGSFCYDMMYGAKPTAFMQWCRDRGATQTVDGLGMLVEQAAESFYIWRGVRPDTAPVIGALRGM